MKIEARRKRAFPIFVQPPTGQRNKYETAIWRTLANASRGFIAVHTRHTNVDKNQFRLEFFNNGDAQRAIEFLKTLFFGG